MSFSNHHFSRAMLNFGGVSFQVLPKKVSKSQIFWISELCFMTISSPLRHQHIAVHRENPRFAARLHHDIGSGRITTPGHRFFSISPNVMDGPSSTVGPDICKWKAGQIGISSSSNFSKWNIQPAGWAQKPVTGP